MLILCLLAFFVGRRRLTWCQNKGRSIISTPFFSRQVAGFVGRVDWLKTLRWASVISLQVLFDIKNCRKFGGYHQTVNNKLNMENDKREKVTLTVTSIYYQVVLFLKKLIRENCSNYWFLIFPQHLKTHTFQHLINSNTCSLENFISFKKNEHAWRSTFTPSRSDCFI